MITSPFMAIIMLPKALALTYTKHRVFNVYSFVIFTCGYNYTGGRRGILSCSLCLEKAMVYHVYDNVAVLSCGGSIYSSCSCAKITLLKL